MGGRLVDNTDDISVQGALVTGLNEQLLISPGASSIGGTGSLVNPESTKIGYNSNEVRRALSALVGFVPLHNAWMDNWAMY